MKQRFTQKKLNKAKEILKRLREKVDIDNNGLFEIDLLVIVYNEL